MKWQLKQGSSRQWLVGMTLVLGSAMVSATVRADVVIVESGTDGLNHAWYQETGSWNEAGYKSQAGGLQATHSRYAMGGTPAFSVNPTLGTAGGTYDVFVTMPTTDLCSTNLVVKITLTGGEWAASPDTTLFRSTGPIHTWGLVGRMILNPGVSAPTIKFEYASGNLNFLSRFYADAVRFEEVTDCTVEIVAPPTSQIVPEGGNATFTVSATGAGTLTYEWTWKGQVVQPDPLDPSKLTLTNVQLADSGSKVAVTITDDNCSVTSDEVTLTVQKLPEILDQPDNVSIVAGWNAYFEVVASSTLQLHYEWHIQRVGQPTSEIVGDNAPFWTRLNAQPADHGATVWVKVTDSIGGSVESEPALLWVTGFAEQPRPVYVAEGNKAVFKVVGVGPGTLSYAWAVNGEPAGTNSPTLELANVKPGDHGATVQAMLTSTTDTETLTATSTTVLLRVVQCNVPYADADGDLDVDQEDFGLFQACMTGDGAGAAGLIAGGYCACFDQDPGAGETVEGDGDVDEDDLALFEQNVTGPAVPWTPRVLIVKHLKPVIVGRGATARFDVQAVGTAPLSYKWSFGQDTVESDLPTLLLPDCQLADDGKTVSVLVTDALDSEGAKSEAVLTVVPCNVPYADADGDQDVDQADFGFFQACMEESELGLIIDDQCYCFDRDPDGSDGDVDADDLVQFHNCWTGPGIPFDADNPPANCLP
ncbi:MAG: immunoglobulin domain-containing protein [Phycisphaerae bacterium]|jgi:hypothetical protein|nr:immunoglobulin domain-containing protein [Phycisphaerae bacterium]